MVDRKDVKLAINVNTTELKKSIPKVVKELIDLQYKRMIVATEFLKSEAVKEAPSDTGELRARMFKRTLKERNQVRGIIGNTSEYAAYVHQGTGIYAKNGKGRKTPWKVVTMYKGKKVVFVTRGQKSNPFLTRAKEKNIESIKKILGVK